MIDTTTADHHKFLFRRELDQIYLLLDHISMNPDKHLPGAVTPPNPNADNLFVTKIAKIQYPPPTGALGEADQAAALILALDELNRAAAPATGMTIAFTLMVSGEKEQEHFRRRMARANTAHAGAIPARTGAAGMGGSRLPPDPRDPLAPGGAHDTPTRLDLANRAFPTLIAPAKVFTAFNTVFIWVLASFFFLTCLLSWDVTAGNALLGQLNALTAIGGDVAKQIATAEYAKDAKGLAVPGAGRTAGLRYTPLEDYCDAYDAPDVASAPTGESSPAKSVKAEPLDSTSGVPLCTRARELKVRVLSARNNLREWVHAWPWSMLAPTMDDRTAAVVAAGTDPMPMIDANPRDEVDAQWAAALLNVLTTAVLPICYGLLGANAAVIRGISSKIKASVLGPRDLMLSIVQLVLGAIIGGVIGLFITPAGDAAKASPGVFGSVGLSASALCFIAGFGVEGVFVALESLVHRIFNIADPSGKPAAGK